MAKKKTLNTRNGAGSPIDSSFTETYVGGVVINRFAVLKEEIKFAKTGNTSADYIPDEGVFYFERPDLGLTFKLEGKFITSGGEE